MNTEKNYTQMDVAERTAHLAALATFVHETLPALTTQQPWTLESTQAFEQGLQLLSAHPLAHPFIAESRTFRDYPRRLTRFHEILDFIREEIAETNALRTATGETLAYIPIAQPQRRRGRPTLEEAAEATQLEAQYATQEALATALAQFLGTPIVQAAAPCRDDLHIVSSTTPPPADTTPSLFDQPTEITPEALKATQLPRKADVHVGSSATPLQLGTLPTLAQLRWLLSPSLAARTESIQTLRAEAASAAEQAKGLYASGAPTADIEPLTARATAATAEYRALYEEIDLELAKQYDRFLFDEHHFDAHPEYQANPEYWRETLAHYYQKVLANNESPTPDTTPSNETTSSDTAPTPQEAKLIAKHRAYIRRTDVTLNQKRIDEVTRRIEEIEALGGETADLKLILQKLIKDLSEAQ